MDLQLRQCLLDMAAEDARVRAELAASGELFQGYAPRMAEVDDRNAKALAGIIAACGWPGRSLVGENGAAAAWLIVQHAIGQPALLRACLLLLREAAARGEAEAARAAMLEDRICFFERRPQRYGTQWDCDEHGRMAPWTIGDPDNVDARRASVGLGPLADSEAAVEHDSGSGTAPDYRQRQREMLEWARSAGWL